MRMYDIIAAKRDGKTLSQEEIHYFVQGYTQGTIPDYQAAALLMAIFLRGMTPEETSHLTMSMAFSGETVDLSSIPGIKVDKHSTGGVGDKTTLVVCPIAAACGVPIAKMSGRGLGHTGGTIDKLESIPGYRTQLSREEFFQVIRKTGISVIGQSGNIAPADKKIYALRDVIAATESLPLIASSIMSKKIAAGSDAILLDVKTGSGAFMKTLEDSVALAKAMVSIGEHTGRRTAALITDMDVPLGNAVGNALEVKEALETLRGNGPEDFTQVCLALAEEMLYLGGKGEREDCRLLAEEALATGSALSKFREMVFAQGGDVSALDDPEGLPGAKVQIPLYAQEEGYVHAIQTQQVGVASVLLGCGRETKEDSIDYGAGIRLAAKVGDHVKKGQLLATLYSNKEEKICPAGKLLLKSYQILPDPVLAHKLVLGRVTSQGVKLW